MWGRWGRPQNFLLAFIDVLWRTQENQTFEQKKKFAADIIILNMCTKNHNYMKYSSWDTKWDRVSRHFGPYFALLTSCPLTTQKKQNFEGMKKEFGDVIVLNLCNKKHDHMMYAYSDVGYWHRHDFLSFQVIFCSFAPLLTLKIKVWKKRKKNTWR